MINWMDALKNARARIEVDKKACERVGKNVKGHIRAIMIIDETILDLYKYEQATKDRLSDNLDTHAADIETVREALNDYRKVEPSGQLLGRLHKALDALKRLEGK